MTTTEWQLLDGSDQYASLWLCHTHGLSIPVRIPAGVSIPEGALKEIQGIDESWQKFRFDAGQAITGKIEGPLIDWIAPLAKVGLLKIDLEKWLAAQAAKAKWLAAQEEYKQAILALGGEWQEEGSYEDYSSWLKIPGVPGRYCG